MHYEPLRPNRTTDIIEKYEFTHGESSVCVYDIETLDFIKELDKLYANVILRCPVIPDVNDRYEHFENIGKLANQHKCIKYIELMRYHPLGMSKAKQIDSEIIYNNTNFLNKDTAEEYAEAIRKITKKTVIIS